MDDYRQDEMTDGVIQLGQYTIGTIAEPGDVDWFRIGLKYGYSYRIQVFGDGVLPLALPALQVRFGVDGGRTVKVAEHNFPSDSDFLFKVVPPDSLAGYNGVEFLAIASGFSEDTGHYAILVQQIDDFPESTQTTGIWNPLQSRLGSLNQAAQPLADEWRGVIESASDRDWFAADLVAGRKYRFVLMGLPDQLDSAGLADPVLRVHGINGDLFATSDEQTGNTESFEFMAAQNGRHYVSAGGFLDHTGRYKLQFQAVDDNVGMLRRLAIGSAGVTGDIEFYSDVDWYRISVGAGRTYKITFQVTGVGAPGQDLDFGTLILRNDLMQVVQVRRTDSTLEFEFTPERNGDYALIARNQSLKASDGLYFLKIEHSLVPVGDDFRPGTVDMSQVTKAPLSSSLPRLNDAPALAIERASADKLLVRPSDCTFHLDESSAAKAMLALPSI
jgi:hypothetical protein